MDRQDLSKNEPEKEVLLSWVDKSFVLMLIVSDVVFHSIQKMWLYDFLSGVVGPLSQKAFVFESLPASDVDSLQDPLSDSLLVYKRIQMGLYANFNGPTRLLWPERRQQERIHLVLPGL